jgi:hypothetical protein
MGDKLEIIRNSRDINFIKNNQVNINTNLKAENTYDAIVIGSGISGWAAKEHRERSKC